MMPSNEGWWHQRMQLWYVVCCGRSPLPCRSKVAHHETLSQSCCHTLWRSVDSVEFMILLSPQHKDLQDAQLHFSAVRPRLHELRQVSRGASRRDRKFTEMAFKIKAEKHAPWGVDKMRNTKRSSNTEAIFPIPAFESTCIRICICNLCCKYHHIHMFSSRASFRASCFDSQWLHFKPETPCFISASLILASSATSHTIPNSDYANVSEHLQLLISGSLTCQHRSIALAFCFMSDWNKAQVV